MSQEPAAEDVLQETGDVAQPPLEELRETDLDEGASGLKEDELDAKDVQKDEIVSALRRTLEDVGQISELSSEEGKIVEAFSLALLKLMQPLAKAIPVDPSALSKELGDVERANIIPRGELIVLHREGGMESIDLSDEANRDLLVDVVKDVMPKFVGLVAERRAKIERRMDFLATVTRELQNIAEAFASAIG